jgi:uncharacterized protein
MVPDAIARVCAARRSQLPPHSSHSPRGDRAKVRAMYFHFHNQTKKILGHLGKWIETAEAHAKAKSFDANVFVDSRLAPDQFAFVRQVQSSCDTAKFLAARLSGKESPSFPDTERTLEELKARIQKTIAYLDTFTEKDYEGAATRVITTPRWEGKVQSGADYFMEHAVPNFYFHVTTAYAILRHNGVNVGKKDFLGHQSRRDP